MIDLDYSLVIEAYEEPDYFGFYSPDLEGFTGVGHSIERLSLQSKMGNERTPQLIEGTGTSYPSQKKRS